MMDAKQRFSNLLETLSFGATRLLVTFEQYMPSYLKPRRTSTTVKERNEFARALIQQEVNETYTLEQILHCRNIINANDISRMEMSRHIDLEGALTRFKRIHPAHGYIEDLNVLSLLPFRTQCNNLRDGIECGEQLRVEFHMTAFVIYPTTIRPCTLYNADCKYCKRSYRVSSVYLSAERQFIVTPESLEKNEYFHLSFGKLVFSREMLVSFSSDLVNGHISFNGASTSVLSKVARLHPDIEKKIDPVQLARSLEAHWTYYELFNLIFMISLEKYIVVPRALFSGVELRRI